jgi:hypothetical protein
VIVKDLRHLVFQEIPHNDVAITPCAGKVVTVDADAQNAPFVDTFNGAENGTGGKVPFLDCAVLGPREKDLIASIGIRIELEAIYRVGVGSRGSP